MSLSAPARAATAAGTWTQVSNTVDVPRAGLTYHPSADWFLPAGTAKGLVHLQHGFSRSNGNLADLAEHYAAAGFVVFAPTLPSAGIFGCTVSNLGNNDPFLNNVATWLGQANSSGGTLARRPGHTRVIFGVPGLHADGAEATWTVAWAAAENARTGSPLKGQIDAGTLLLTGHSFGGAAGLGLTTGPSTPPFTDVPVPAPSQLRAAAFYGTDNAAPGSPGIPPVANTVPVALIQGAADGIGSPANGLGTCAVLQGVPKLYVSVAGARPDLSPQTLNQAAGVENIARWAALWLRAQLGDPVGAAWVYGIGDAVDAGVETQFVR
ncbi:hypothetical protein [Dactylosporangium sp. NPDC000521]|uniref:hypothetical protein n=1 Tax=Dactylosporangium sp. NPDC000521 TaxID=3363975 RepID=UPI00369FB815